MKKIILQAGHYGRTSGSTGAPGEAGFNWDVVNKTAEILRKYFEVRVVKADPTTAEITGDWDCFLAIHYDADLYGKGGYFVDFADPATDSATQESQRITGILSKVYGQETGIVNHPERSNVNTRKYYMWSKLSAKTPCVLIECGVGQHKPDDYEILFNQREKVINALVKGILSVFNIQQEEETMTEAQTRILKFLEEQGADEGKVREAFGALSEISGLKSNIESKDKEIQTLQKKISNLELSLKSLTEKVDDLADKLTEKEKSATEYQRQINTANKTISNITEELATANKDKADYKKWYEAALSKSAEKLSAVELLKLLIKKIKTK